MPEPEDKTQYLQTKVDDAGVRVAEEYRRRKVTSILAVVFTDIERSTQLREELGEVVYESHREKHARVIRDLVESGGAGALVKDTGDGALAVFAEPSAAVMRALEIQSAVKSHPIFKLRVGIDMGQVSVASRGGIIADVFGRQVNRAARIQSLAHPQHVLTSFPVYDCAVGWLAGTNVRWHHHGATSLKGFTDEFSIHEPYDPQLTGPQTAPWQKPSIKMDETGIFHLGLPSDEVGRSVETAVQDPFEVLKKSAMTRTWQSPPRARRTPWGLSWFRRKKKVVLHIPPPPPLAPLFLGPVRCPPGADPIRFYEQEIQNQIRIRAMLSRSTRILWVDDFPENTLFERRALTAAGCQFVLATSTRQAIRRLNRITYDLVITDMGRGENPTAGLELLEWMLASRVPSPRFVYCSSRASSVYGEQAVELGASLCTPGMISLFDGIFQVLCRYI